MIFLPFIIYILLNKIIETFFYIKFILIYNKSVKELFLNKSLKLLNIIIILLLKVNTFKGKGKRLIIYLIKGNNIKNIKDNIIYFNIINPARF